MSSTGGASFFPYMKERPEYPPVTYVLFHLVREYARDVILGTAMVMALYPSSQRLAFSFQGLGWTERQYWTLMTSLAHTLSFLAFSLPFIVCDANGWLRRYKAPRQEHQIPDSKQMATLWKESVLGQCVTSPLFGYFAYPLVVKLGSPPPFQALDLTWTEVAKWMCIAHAFNDILFYWTHRIFHYKPIYKRFHKQRAPESDRDALLMKTRACLWGLRGLFVSRAMPSDPLGAPRRASRERASTRVTRDVGIIHSSAPWRRPRSIPIRSRTSSPTSSRASEVPLSGVVCLVNLARMREICDEVRRSTVLCVARYHLLRAACPGPVVLVTDSTPADVRDS